MKTKPTWSTSSPLAWGPLALRAALLILALCLGFEAAAATIKISQEPVTTAIGQSDIFLIDQSNGDGTYTTKTISFANLGLSGQSTTYVTNLYVTTQVVTNLFVTTNQVNQSFVTNQFVMTSYTTNLYVTTEVSTNLTVTQIFKGNQTFITNLTVTGSSTNLALTPSSIMATDPNDAQTTIANGGAHTFPEGTTPPAFRLLQGNDFKFTTLIPTSNGTNYVVDFSLTPDQNFDCTNDVAFLYVTNGPGVASLKFRPAGADRKLYFPTNWVWLRTNYLTLDTTKNPGVWEFTLTNAQNGSGPRLGYLSVSQMGTGTGVDPTNTLALFQESP